ncbi:UNVERIFIED_CONTAM: hypothetical protein RKD50_000345 [Streptomyces canus]
MAWTTTRHEPHRRDGQAVRAHCGTAARTPHVRHGTVAGPPPGSCPRTSRPTAATRPQDRSAATRTALLDWALHIVEDIGPDVRDAWREFRHLHAGGHPSHHEYDGLPQTERGSSSSRPRVKKTRNRPATRSARVSSRASVRVDFTVYRSGDIGPPRTSGSTRANSAIRSPGSRSAALRRPPPGRRTRPRGSSPASSSNTPLRTVVSLTAAACATARTPPCPRPRASAAINSRRCRSSRCGSNTGNFTTSWWRVSSGMGIPHQRASEREASP